MNATFDHVHVAGVRVAATDIDSATAALVAAAASGTPNGLAVHLVNSWSVVCASRDPAMNDALARTPGSINLPDGVPVARLVARRSGVASVGVRAIVPQTRT